MIPLGEMLAAAVLVGLLTVLWFAGAYGFGWAIANGAFAFAGVGLAAWGLQKLERKR